MPEDTVARVCLGHFASTNLGGEPCVAGHFPTAPCRPLFIAATSPEWLKPAGAITCDGTVTQKWIIPITLTARDGIAAGIALESGHRRFLGSVGGPSL